VHGLVAAVTDDVLGGHGHAGGDGDAGTPRVMTSDQNPSYRCHRGQAPCRSTGT
jgi:hypothetical protein